MDNLFEDEIAGGPKGSSGDVEDGLAAIKRIATHFSSMAMTEDGEMSATARLQDQLRSDDRAPILNEIVDALLGKGIDSSVMLTWIRGGKSPFTPTALKKVGGATEWPSQTLLRTSPRVTKQQAKVDKMKADLVDEEKRLTYLKAHDHAALHWIVADHLLHLIGPAIAMGPAWVVLRAISAHMSDEHASAKTWMFDGEEKTDAIEGLRKQRAYEADLVMQGLDLWAGNEEFEDEVRAGILAALGKMDGKKQEWINSGRRRRRPSEIRDTVNPEATLDSAEVLEGLKRKSAD